MLLVAGASCGGELEPASTSEAPADGGEAVTAAVRAVPCAPRAVLATVCEQCHSSPPKNGAPYALVDLADVQRERDGEPTSAAMLALVEQRRMPLAPVKITEEQRGVLLDWLRSGAPAATPGACP